MFFGYSSFKDMFDGGGKGKSGSSFSTADNSAADLDGDNYISEAETKAYTSPGGDGRGGTNNLPGGLDGSSPISSYSVVPSAADATANDRAANDPNYGRGESSVNQSIFGPTDAEVAAFIRENPHYDSSSPDYMSPENELKRLQDKKARSEGPFGNMWYNQMSATELERYNQLSGQVQQSNIATTADLLEKFANGELTSAEMYDALQELKNNPADNLTQEQKDTRAKETKKKFNEQVQQNLAQYMPPEYADNPSANPYLKSDKFKLDVGTGYNFRPTAQQLSYMLQIPESVAKSYLDPQGMQFDFRNWSDILNSEDPYQSMTDATFAMYLTPDIFGTAGATGPFSVAPEGFDLPVNQNFLYTVDPSFNPNYKPTLSLTDLASASSQPLPPVDPATEYLKDVAPIRSGQPNYGTRAPMTSSPTLQRGSFQNTYATDLQPILPTRQVDLTRNTGIRSLTDVETPYDRYYLRS